MRLHRHLENLHLFHLGLWAVGSLDGKGLSVSDGDNRPSLFVEGRYDSESRWLALKWIDELGVDHTFVRRYLRHRSPSDRVDHSRVRGLAAAC